MSNMIMILGESGTGKSTSIENLKPEETFIIQVVNKPLPFKGFKNKYTILSKENDKGNRYITDRSEQIVKIFDLVNKRTEITNLIIDDSQYIMANEYMRRGTEKGYDKFSEIAMKFFNVVDKAMDLRENLNVIFLHHTDISDTGKIKAKTVGKLIDNAVTLEGRFSTVLMAEVDDGKYYFRTQNNGYDTCKSPRGMFEDLRIPNDLQYVVEKANEFFI